MNEFENENNQNFEVELTASKKPTKATNEGHLTVDVFQTEDEIVVQSTIAGASKENIDISVTQDMVTIKGRREPETPIKPSNYFHQELYWGPFSRAIILPMDVDSESARAVYKNGVLTIRLPKLEKVRTKKVKISP